MKNIKKIMQKEFSQITPQQSEKLKATKLSAKKLNKTLKLVFLPICAAVFFCCVLTAVFLMPSQGEKVYALGSYISLSFNPSFSIIVDDNGTVEGLVSENYDAEIVLSGLSLSGAQAYGSYQQVLFDVICESANLGYFEEVETIYVEVFCYQEDESALNVLFENISETLNLAISGKNISVSEMKKEDILQKAKEIDGTITDDVDGEKLRQTMKNMQSYSEKLQESVQENKEKLLELYDLQILNCTMTAIEDMQKIYAEIQEICLEESIEESEIFSSDNQRIKELLDDYSKTIEWFGLEVTSENLGYLLKDYSPLTEEKNRLVEVIDNFKQQGALPDDTFSKDALTQNETISYYYVLACEKYAISEDCNADEILRAITELETFARLSKFGD